MISIKIDGVEITTVSPTTLSLSLSAECMRSVESAALDSDFVVEVEVAASNREAQLLLAGEGHLHDGAPFNLSSHEGAICYDGEELVTGAVTLLSTTVEGDAVRYSLRVRRSGAEWASTALDNLIHEVSLEYFEQLDMALMEESWSDDSFIKFFPVHRDSYSSTYSSTSLSTVQRIRSIDDYHPFLNIYTVMMKIFSEAGYSVESDFMESSNFKKLYMSGAYVSQDSAGAKENMDFYIVKLEDQTSTGDVSGYVMMTPLYTNNSVGFLADYESIDERSECYSLNGCMSVKYSSLCFTPTQAVSMGLEVRLLYISEYRIKSRTELKAFDTLYLEGSMLYDFGVANKFVDQRYLTLEMLFDYVVVVFDGDSSLTYLLTITVNGVESTLSSWVGMTGEITTPRFEDGDTVGELKLYIVLNSWQLQYTGDWALYMGYVEVEGEVEVDVTVRTPPKSVSPSSPLYLTSPFVSGGEQGMSFTLKAESSISPFFAGYPGFGSYVEYSDLAQHEFQASDFVESVRHLFNLAIYSDIEGSKVYIEPTEDMYDSSVVWDWSDKVIDSKAITFSDLAVEGWRHRKWGYQSSDGVTTRIASAYYEAGETYPDAPTAEPEQSIENSYCPEYGSWVVDLENYVAAESTHTELNPILSPTINDTLGVPIVGDRENPDMADTLEFSPRILSYEGFMVSDNELVPNTVFFSELLSVNLGFEDRDDVVGLNKYYEEQVKREESGRYVELSLRLTPSELLMLYSPTAGMPHILSTFGLTILGEWCEARIESIEMTAGEGDNVAKCKFLIIK